MLIGETPIEVEPLKHDTGTISSSFLWKFLKAFFQNMRKKSPKILLKAIRGKSDHNLIKIPEKRTKQIFIGNLKFEMHAFLLTS